MRDRIFSARAGSNRVVDALDPFHVGAEAGLAGHVGGEVHPKAPGFRHRIDQA